MKKMLVMSLIIGGNVFAQAQTTVSTVENSPTQQVANDSAVTAAASQSTAATVDVAPPANKVTGSFYIGAWAMVSDLKENGSNALVDSSNTLNILYTLSDRIKIGVGHNFGMRVISDRSQLADYNSDSGSDNAYKNYDPTIHFNYSMPSIFGSNAYSILTKYYVPVTKDSTDKKSNGILRTQAYVTWSVNAKVDLSFFGQARLYLNSSGNPDEARGGDSVLRTIVGPVFGYNFNSVWNVYYNPYLDMRSAGYQRGKFDADVVNSFAQETGIWLTLGGGKYIVNPAFVTTSSKLGNSTYEGSGSDANSEWDLNLIAMF